MFCVHCGRGISDTDLFCASCGKPIPTQQATTDEAFRPKKENEWQTLLKSENNTAGQTPVQPIIQQPETQQFTQPQYAQPYAYNTTQNKGGALKKSIIITVVVCVLLASVVGLILALKQGATPEKAVERMFVAMQEKDMDEIVRLSIYNDEINGAPEESAYLFNSSTMYDYLDSICEKIQEKTIIVKDAMIFKQDEISSIRITSYNKNDAEEFALVYYYIVDQEEDKQIFQTYCIKVQGKWYVNFLQA